MPPRRHKTRPAPRGPNYHTPGLIPESLKQLPYWFMVRHRRPRFGGRLSQVIYDLRTGSPVGESTGGGVPFAEAIAALADGFYSAIAFNFPAPPVSNENGVSTFEFPGPDGEPLSIANYDLEAMGLLKGSGR